MSGIVIILNLDGQPVSQGLLERMTAFMAYRGQDAQQTWVDGKVGFGHALLRTTTESQHEHQPPTIDGHVWITADARIDGRADLVELLESRGWPKIDHPTDAEIILGAYGIWGEACLERLIGDFAFAIWDRRENRLFCARDQLGVKQLYYAQVGNTLVLSNTLNCIRLHPNVSNGLNDLAIADFLLFEYNREPTTTAFADIYRLPPAYTLTCVERRLYIRRYWTLPIKEPVQYKTASDYVDRFVELLSTAVDDRLRTNQAAVLMSGGVDSTAVAAMAVRMRRSPKACSDIHAYTVVYDRLIPDDERYYSGVAADALSIPIHYFAADNYRLYDRWDDPALQTPEPSNNPRLASERDLYRQIAATSRVLLTGQGGDPALDYSVSYGLNILRHGRLIHFLTQLYRSFFAEHCLPAMGIRTTLKRLIGIVPAKPPYPNWLNNSFENKLNLPHRWSALQVDSQESLHPTRPESYNKLAGTFWGLLCEHYDASRTLAAIEVRHPFFDLRLLDYLLTVPPLPWFVNKSLARTAMRPCLPEIVRQRPKTPLQGDPLFEILKKDEKHGLENVAIGPELAPYVNTEVLSLEDLNDPYTAWVNLRPYSLSQWLKKYEKMV